MTWDEELALGNIKDKRNLFKWESVAKNLTRTPTYDCCRKWVYKEISDRIIAADIFLYVDEGQTIGLTEEVCWEESRKWRSKCSWLGIQDASRKVQGHRRNQGHGQRN